MEGRAPYDVTARKKEDPMAMVTDPVCGMRIEDSEAAGTAEHEGRTYHFCSEACRDAFVADPAAYAGAGS